MDERSVCRRCINEESLGAFIYVNASLRRCSFCGRRSAKRFIAMPLDDLLAHIRERIECEYEDAANNVGYESAEGGYLLPTMTGYDLLQSVGLNVENSDLLEALVQSLSDQPWVHSSPYSLPEEDALRLSWEEYSRLIKHEVRYLLFPPEPDHTASEGPRPAQMLSALGDIFIRYGLVSTLKAGTRLFRVRIRRPGDRPRNTLDALGPPPIEFARYSNRMSPAGVSMFYAALDEATGLAETYVRLDGSPAEATIATFKTTEDLVVLNLANLPRIPSIFDNDEANLNRPELIFLHSFVDDLTQSVVKDGREHVEYVPSQVVTEYVRYRLSEKIGSPVHGILYRSTRTKEGIGCVLFTQHKDCVQDKVFGRPPAAPFVLLAKRTRTIPVRTNSLGDSADI